MNDSTFDLKFPDLGVGLLGAAIETIYAKVGDVVEVHDSLMLVSTDKVNVELPSPVDGVVLEILVEEQDKPSPGTTIARLDLRRSQPR